jgi:hypothetical protein
MTDRRKPIWHKPVVVELKVEELESLAELDVIFATSSSGCDIHG